MNFPNFNAESSLGKPTRTYRDRSRYGELSPGSIALMEIGELDGDLGSESLEAGDEAGLMDETDLMDEGDVGILATEEAEAGLEADDGDDLMDEDKLGANGEEVA